MAEVSSFERVIKEDRAARESKQWRGTLLEYLEVIKADPTVTKLSHARIYDMIIACRYSVSFLKTSINSTRPRLPTLSAPFSSSTRGSPSEY